MNVASRAVTLSALAGTTLAASQSQSCSRPLDAETGAEQLFANMLALASARKTDKGNDEYLRWFAEVTGVADVIRNSKSLRSLDYA
jgi:hypothetical protein